MSLNVDRNLHEAINDLQVLVCGLEDLKTRSRLTKVELHREVDRLLQIALETGGRLHESRKDCFRCRNRLDLLIP